MIQSGSQVTPNDIRDLIVLGRIPGGSRLVETELALRFKVSRNTLREALRALQMEGLIEFEFHRKIWELAGHRRLLQILSGMQKQTMQFMLETTDINKCSVDNVSPHYALFDVLGAGNPDGAEQPMRIYIYINRLLDAFVASWRAENGTRLMHQ